MENHASDFSVAGIFDNIAAALGATDFQPGHTFAGSAAFGNNLTGAYFALFGNSDQSTSNALTTAVNVGLTGTPLAKNVGVVGGFGTNLTAGARGSALMALNLAGKPGVGAQVLARSPALRSRLAKLGKYGKATTVIDAGLALGEAIDCAAGALP
jgi:hypothetical protein